MFTRQAIPMVWDYSESNVFAGAAGDFRTSIRTLSRALETTPGIGAAKVDQIDATAITESHAVYSTDPPYFDNISYAELSDFFYVWLRKSLFTVYPALFSTLLVPKTQELVATPARFEGSREKAEQFFETGFGKAVERMRLGQIPDYPLTIFYAFKQSEGDDDTDSNGIDGSSVASTGWETMLEGLLRANFQITGTWPMRSERATRSVARGTNALASSIVLVCRPRASSATLTTRKDFLTALKRELGPAIRTLQLGNIAPVDLQQAAIGPGMGIFSRYTKVIESDGGAMKVRTALGLINQALDEVLSAQESDYDSETRWALSWFEQNQFNDGAFGDANVLASAKALSVEGMQNAGLLLARAGKVRLLRRDELSIGWSPSEDRHLTVWKVTQHLIHRLATRGQDAARGLAAELGGMADVARELAYRLYTLCERKGWAEEAGYYNALVIAWPAIRSHEFTLTGDK
jgi:putative DNA methylase